MKYLSKKGVDLPGNNAAPGDVTLWQSQEQAAKYSKHKYLPI